MKQKMVIKVHMNDQKSRSKAMKIVVGVPGVESAALQGEEKNKIEVIGDGVDAVVLTTLLRKKVGYAELESISAVGEEVKEDGVNTNEATVQPPLICTSYPHYQMLYECREYPNHDSNCSIL